MSRVYAQRKKYPKLFSAKDRTFFDALESLLAKLWSNESLATLGPAANDPGLLIECIVRQGYQPPDDFSVEAILARVEHCEDDKRISCGESTAG